MASRYSQYLQNDRSSRLQTTPARSHPNHPPSNESTPAYGSKSYQKMDRLSRAPKAENDSKLTKAFSHWLGKHKIKSAANPERLRISDPKPILPLQAPLRPNRPPDNQTLLPTSTSRILPELQVQKPLPKVPVIQPQNLGRAHEALSSHLVGARLSGSKGAYPTRQTAFSPAVEDGSNDEITTQDEVSPLRPPTPEPYTTPCTKAKRRRGRIFSDGDVPRNLYEFPDPDSWHDEGDEESDDDYFWDDAGFDDVGEPSNRESVVPQIIVSSADDDRRASQRTERSKDRLSVDDCYKVLWHEQRREVRGLRSIQQYLLPLAWLVSEAENVDIDDLPALQDALKTIIGDREKLSDLFPLAQMLAKDQKLDINDFKALPRALKNILADRDNAKRVAEYQRRMRREVEAEMEGMAKVRHYDSDDDEDYIRL